jgi:hypothetical protein
MAYLKYYSEEHKVFPEAYEEKISEATADLYFNRLRKHYKFPQRLEFGGRRAGTCSSYMVRLHRRDISVGILAHEVAHALQYKKRNQGKEIGKWHTKMHRNLMRKVIAYINAHKNKWVERQKLKNDRSLKSWENKVKREQERAEYKKTYDYKLSKLRQREKKLTSRAKRINTLLKKVKASIKRYERKISEQKI